MGMDDATAALGADLLAYAGIPTFMRQPATRNLAGADVVVAGVPYDSGAISYRSGARMGPRAIRAVSPLLWGYHRVHRVAPTGRLAVVDYGDIMVRPSDAAATLAAIADEAKAILDAGPRLLALGGDHAVTLPLLQAHCGRYGPLAVLHLDAHSDTWAGPWDHSSAFRLAIEQGLIVQGGLIQVGIRGPLWSAEDVITPQRLGAQVWTADMCHERGLGAVLEAVRQIAALHPLYVSVDMDVFDPAYAPGVGTPEVGGLNSHQVLQLLRGLADLRLVGADIVELCPPYDPAEITAVLAANIAFELLSLFAVNAERL